MGPTLHWITDPVALVVGALAVYRLTRLLTADYLLEGPRARVAERGGALGYFVTCPWCVSVWVGAVWAALLVLVPVVALVAGAALAWSAVAALLSSHLE